MSSMILEEQDGGGDKQKNCREVYLSSGACIIGHTIKIIGMT